MDVPFYRAASKARVREAACSEHRHVNLRWPKSQTTRPTPAGRTAHTHKPYPSAVAAVTSMADKECRSRWSVSALLMALASPHALVTMPDDQNLIGDGRPEEHRRRIIHVSRSRTGRSPTSMASCAPSLHSTRVNSTLTAHCMHRRVGDLRGACMHSKAR